MASVNKTVHIGNLGADPIVRYSANGSAIANFSIATTRRFKNKDTNEWKEEVEWHRVSLFGRLAEVAGEYLRKGSSVYIEGRLQTRKWQDKDGQDRYTTEIVGEIMQLLGGRQESDSYEGGYRSQQAPRSSRNEYAQASGGTARPGHTQVYGNSDPNEDVPF